ncbi:hypothetical protein QJQ45_013142 [Haematococcus lacustris]|nr:hypothetical protein QJQ45_013142 [Haematococcus lacustris]
MQLSFPLRRRLPKPICVCNIHTPAHYVHQHYAYDARVEPIVALSLRGAGPGRLQQLPAASCQLSVPKVSTSSLSAICDFLNSTTLQSVQSESSLLGFRHAKLTSSPLNHPCALQEERSHSLQVPGSTPEALAKASPPSARASSRPEAIPAIPAGHYKQPGNASIPDGMRPPQHSPHSKT